jgi:hypothetical protein
MAKAPKNLKAGEEDYPSFRPFPLYAILICGLLVIIAGLFITVNSGWLSGTTFAGRFGRGGGQNVTSFGPGIIVIGVGMCYFPAAQLVKNKRRMRKPACGTNLPE